MPGENTVYDLQDTAKDLEVCRSNCEREFKLVWHLYVLYQQQRYPIRNTLEISNQSKALIERALDDVLNAFLNKPFSITPEGTDRIPYSRLTELNRDNSCAQRHKAQMKQAGEEWVRGAVDNRQSVAHSGKAISRVQALGQLQTTLFELLWANTVEQLKRHGSGWAAANPANHSEAADKEQAEFRKDLLELESALEEAILRAKKQRFAIAFCGMVKAGKSLFLNALIGEPILPSDGV